MGNLDSGGFTTVLFKLNPEASKWIPATTRVSVTNSCLRENETKFIQT